MSMKTSNEQRPIQWRIACIWIVDHFLIYDVPPWGLILPEWGGMSDMIGYLFEVDTLDMPKGTMIGIRWTAKGSNDVHVLTAQVSEDNEAYTRLRIPDDWVIRYAAQDVLVECEVSYLDGTVEIAPSFELHVAKHVQTAGMTLADLSNGDVMDPEKYPDGVAVRIEPIGNVEPYQTIRLTWDILGFVPGDPQPIRLNLWDIRFSGETGKAYEFVVPPEAYSGYGDPKYSKIEARVHATVKLVPAQIQRFEFGINSYTFPMPLKPL